MKTQFLDELSDSEAKAVTGGSFTNAWNTFADLANDWLDDHHLPIQVVKF